MSAAPREMPPVQKIPAEKSPLDRMFLGYKRGMRHIEVQLTTMPRCLSIPHIYVPRLVLIASIAFILMLPACGGGGDKKPSPAPAPAPAPCTTGPNVPLKAPTTVSVAGAPVGGVDIDVGGPQSCPAANVEVLGVAELSATKLTATNIGATIRRNESKIVIVFGQGLNAGMNVSFGGQPGDFIISNIQGVTSTDKTPGIQFNVTVSPSAAFGARTLILQAANGDVTTFTGGVEVIP